MDDQMTARFGIPLLAAGQAGKELTHNEALTRIDMVMQAAVIAVGLNIPPASPSVGQCWIIGTTPTGDWTGHGRALAGWTTGGWRFARPVEGLQVWSISSGTTVAYRSGVWQEGDVTAARLVIGGKAVVGTQKAAIADPAGGGAGDEVARIAVTAILGALRQHGLIAG